jgi:hypothetical protein
MYAQHRATTEPLPEEHVTLHELCVELRSFGDEPDMNYIDIRVIMKS